MGIKIKRNFVRKQNRFCTISFGISIHLFFLFFFNSIHAQTLSKEDTSNVKFLNSRKFFIYKVEKGETLFNISQKFKIPQEEIVQFNHEIEKNGLKAKMKIWVPAYSWLKKESVFEKRKVVTQIEVQIQSVSIPNRFLILIHIFFKSIQCINGCINSLPPKMLVP